MTESPHTLGVLSQPGLLLWRLIAGGLYGLALLLIPHDLQSALLTLLAASLCLPGTRVALLHHTGLRLGGGQSAVAAGALMPGAAPVAENQPVLAVPAVVEVAVATARVDKS